MKKTLLYSILFIFAFSSLYANNYNSFYHKSFFQEIKSNQPIVFYENGIQFSIQLNGTFTFAAVNTMKNDEKYKNVLVKRNSKGQITGINTVKISYKSNGKINKIGTVDFQYSKRKLVKVGKLLVIYKNNGEVIYSGNVKDVKKTYFKKKPNVRMS